MYCINCGKETSENVKFCPDCGIALNDENSIGENKNQNDVQNAFPQTIILKQEKKATNGIGTAGFIIALCSLVFSWAPGVGFILWLLGFIFSMVGMGRQPKGLATAGFVISLISLVVIILIIIFFGALFSAILMNAK
ncbi:MAG: zinc ribbon domain-containing protein [Flavobacteriaceae bacterium]|jgi:hypothetical protein|nr:zinc ribbon domain-containing protein [Flavobacteriaceae bacterium]